MNLEVLESVLAEGLSRNKINTYGSSGLEIKNSTGISRGKNDKIDARRIADYIVRFAEK